MNTPTAQPVAKVAIRFLLVDDDNIFRERLARALLLRGFEAHQCANPLDAVAIARRTKPHRAVIDLRMPDKNGLEVVKDLAELDEDMQIVVLTGYGSIATAVEAVRRGAIDYLNKPVDTDQILAAFDRDSDPAFPTPAVTVSEEHPPSLARVEWEHIQRILSDCGGNISQAARRLGIHRRSLQRKLGKLPPLE
jgi:two-component system, response regulator RegA